LSIRKLASRLCRFTVWSVVGAKASPYAVRVVSLRSYARQGRRPGLVVGFGPRAATVGGDGVAGGARDSAGHQRSSPITASIPAPER
jgi:hypothetical protein